MCHKWLTVVVVLHLAGVLAIMSGCGGSSAGIGGTVATQAKSPNVNSTAFTKNDDGTSPVLIGYKHGQHGKSEADVVAKYGHSKQRFADLDIEAADLNADGIAALSNNPNVDYVEPDSIVKISRATKPPAYPTYTDTVPANVTQVKAPLCWSKYTGSAVKVAVLDTGIDTVNTDLAPLYKGGYNYVANNTTPKDDNGHGTEVAGTLCAAANNTNLEGVAPSVALYAVKVLDSTGAGTVSNIIAGLQWCVTNKMQVVNMSFGQASASVSLATACTAAEASCVLVAAAGNSGPSPTGNVQFPAACTGVIAVGAVDANNLLATYSCTGPQIALVAPGNNIVTDKMGGGTITISGTSLASPAVAGEAALVISSGVTAPATVVSKLKSTATHLGTTGVNNQYGNGLANCGKACGIAGA